MKYSCSVDISLPKEKVAELWHDPNNLKEWQDGYKGMEQISGEPGAVGSKCKLMYASKRGDFDLHETILINNLPDEFKGEYDHTHMVNTMHTKFTDNPDGSTHYESDFDYTIKKGFILKIIATLFPGMFKKQTQKWLNQFKNFAESKN